MSLSRSSSKALLSLKPRRPERPLGGTGAVPLGPAARRAKPLGMTTIMGAIFLAA